MPLGLLKHRTEPSMWPTFSHCAHNWLWNLATRKVCCSTLRTMRFVSSIRMKVLSSRVASAPSIPSREE